MITFVTGVMQSGKSEVLIRTIENYQGKSLILKSSIDSRDGGYIKSRALDRSVKAMVIDENNHLTRNILWAMLKDYDTVFIDESQFFSEDFFRELVVRCHGIKCHIVACGLTYDFTGAFFPSSFYLYFGADHIGQLIGKCYNCGEVGFTSVKRVDSETGDICTEGESIMVDGSDDDFDYINLCMECSQRWDDPPTEDES